MKNIGLVNQKLNWKRKKGGVRGRGGGAGAGRGPAALAALRFSEEYVEC